jgi:hypothetical protein
MQVAVADHRVVREEQIPVAVADQVLGNILQAALVVRV